MEITSGDTTSFNADFIDERAPAAASTVGRKEFSMILQVYDFFRQCMNFRWAEDSVLRFQVVFRGEIDFFRFGPWRNHRGAHFPDGLQRALQVGNVVRVVLGGARNKDFPAAWQGEGKAFPLELGLMRGTKDKRVCDSFGLIKRMDR